VSHDPIQDDLLGTLTWEEEVWVSEDALLTPKHKINVTVWWDEENEESVADMVGRARQVFTRVRNGEWEFRLAATDAVLELYNENWRQSTQPILDRETFARRITLCSVEVYTDGGFALWYDDQDRLFSGHTIVAIFAADGTFKGWDLPG